MKQLVSKAEKQAVAKPEMVPSFYALHSSDRHTLISLDNGQIVEIITDRDGLGVVTVYSKDSAASAGELF